MKGGHSTLIGLCALCASAASSIAIAQAPARTNREVALEKVATGYRWKLVVAAVPAVGPHEVLVRVFPLEEYEEALKSLQSGKFVGKIVMRMR